MKILISSHGEFAAGLLNSLEMISGSQEDITTILFKPEDEVVDFENRIEGYIKNNEDEPIVCFTDLSGGTPFKTCVQYGADHPNIAIIGGTNLGMLLEASALRESFDSAQDLANLVIDSGKNSIINFELQVTEEDDSGDGI